jgi:hypothetical protein
MLIPWYIQARIQNLNNIIIHKNKIDSTFDIFSIREKLYVCLHGDYDNPQNAVNNITMMLNEKPYAILSAHLHHNALNNIQGVKTIMSGSFLGVDDYAISKRLVGRPQQVICICNQYGIECLYEIEF